jgi:hypothetical protein
VETISYLCHPFQHHFDPHVVATMRGAFQGS